MKRDSRASRRDSGSIAYVEQHVRECAETAEQTAKTCAGQVVRAAGFIARALRAGRKLLLCGNGGSAADCQHLAAEFMVRLAGRLDRPGLPAVALTTDSSLLTAFTNDFGFEGVYARQIQALGQPGDVLLTISTSGNSPNILRAAAEGRRIGLTVIALTATQGRLASRASIAIRVPSRDTQHIQEMHLAIEHAICGLAERELFGSRRKGSPR